jgi:uncharacterized protein YecE (DUF72 family)
MKFGRVADVSKVDFSLPADPPENALRLTEYPEDDRPLSVYVGCTGWSMSEWVGRWYPQGAKTADYLEYYGQQFTTIELNTTHYRIPDPPLVEKWCSRVPDDFRFCPKLAQRISHSKNLGLGGDQLPMFWRALENFGDKLGTCFAQLPPYFGRERIDQLEQFLRIWPKAFPLAMEVRHESWFNDPSATKAFTDLLLLYGHTAVITDVAGRRDVLHQHLVSPQTVVRFNGNGLHPTDYTRINAWVERLAHWQELGLKTAYFFTHEPDNILAPDIALYLVQRMHETTSIKTREPVPVPVGQSKGGQITLF